MSTFIIKDIRKDYRNIIEVLVSEGHWVAPRGQWTNELLGAQLVVSAEAHTLPTGIGRGINPAIGSLEAMQLIAGQQYPKLMVEKAPNFDNFLNGEAFHGSYGERLAPQIGRTLDLLNDDLTTRQAVMTIWDPTRDLFNDGRRDLPCTTQIQCFIRENRLNFIVTMRSNDIWWGVAYDLHQFTQLQLNMAAALDINAGLCIVNAGSLHLYHRDVEAVKRVSRGEELKSSMPAYAQPIVGYGQPWPVYRATAIQILENTYHGTSAAANYHQRTIHGDA